MSSNAKVLPFRSRPATSWLSPKEAQLAAREFLGTPAEERSADVRDRFLGSPDVMMALCVLLRKSRDLAPAAVLDETVQIYRWVSRPDCDLGLFDERDYFLGETALIAGGVCRQLGKREEAFLWLDRAEAGFRHTMNPAPGLANVAYARLALRFEMGRYADVLELAPSLELSFKKLRMSVEAAKCRLLFATTLKVTGEHKKALELLGSLPDDISLEGEPLLRARVLAEVGDLYQLSGHLPLAMGAFQKALLLLPSGEISSTAADLKLYVAAAYKAIGSLENARDAFRAALRDYAQLGMRSLVAYAHLLVAETLLEMKRDREAEWEILAALPAIDEMKMVPEGFAAIALLRESVARRRTNLPALQELRAHLESRT
jgi:tetratricopeptide (TPR) repeat protein